METRRKTSTCAILLAVCAMATVGPRHQSAAESAPEPALVKTTYTYKVVGDCSIQADVYRADDAVVRPGVVWMHGGALVVGSRHGVVHELITVPGGGHGLGGGDPKVIADAHARALEFVKQHLK